MKNNINNIKKGLIRIVASILLIINISPFKMYADTITDIETNVYREITGTIKDNTYFQFTFRPYIEGYYNGNYYRFNQLNGSTAESFNGRQYGDFGTDVVSTYETRPETVYLCTHNDTQSCILVPEGLYDIEESFIMGTVFYGWNAWVESENGVKYMPYDMYERHMTPLTNEMADWMGYHDGQTNYYVSLDPDARQKEKLYLRYPIDQYHHYYVDEYDGNIYFTETGNISINDFVTEYGTEYLTYNIEVAIAIDSSKKIDKAQINLDGDLLNTILTQYIHIEDEDIDINHIQIKNEENCIVRTLTEQFATILLYKNNSKFTLTITYENVNYDLFGYNSYTKQYNTNSSHIDDCKIWEYIEQDNQGFFESIFNNINTTLTNIKTAINNLNLGTSKTIDPDVDNPLFDIQITITDIKDTKEDIDLENDNYNIDNDTKATILELAQETFTPIIETIEESGLGVIIYVPLIVGIAGLMLL